MLLRMTIKGLTIDPLNQSNILLLQAEETGQDLHIWIGVAEAQAIQVEMEGVKQQRPMTHDLLCSILEEVNVSVQRVIVTELKNETFYAVVEIMLNGETYQIDARPSDAIAIAVRTDADIFTDKDVLDAIHAESQSKQKATAEADSATEESSWDDPSKLKDWLDNISPDDFGEDEK